MAGILANLTPAEAKIREQLLALDSNVEKECVKVQTSLDRIETLQAQYKDDLSEHPENKVALKAKYIEETKAAKADLKEFTGTSVAKFDEFNKEKAQMQKADKKSYRLKLKTELSELKAAMKAEYKVVLNDLKAHVDKNAALASKMKLKEIRKGVKAEYKAIDSSLTKKQKIKAKEKIRKAYAKEWIANFEVVRNNTAGGMRQLAHQKIEAKFGKQYNELKNELTNVSPNMSRLGLFLIGSISIAVLVVVALIVNYLVYYPGLPENNGEAYKATGDHIGSIVITTLLLAILVGSTILLLINSSKSLPMERKSNSLPKGLLAGFIANFVDTIGIGSFAPLLTITRALNGFSSDKKIPGVLNAGCLAPVITEAAMFISAVSVDITTLVVLIACACVGSVIGAWLVNKIGGVVIKLIMGIVLIVTAILMIINHPQVNLFNASGTALSLPFTSFKIYVGMVAFLILGALMSFGVGLYGPSMAVVSLLGMNTTAAFPIMMGSCAFLMPFGSIKFMMDKNYDPKLTVGISIAGVYAVFAAFLIVFVGLQVFAGLDKAEFMKWLNWLVVVVIAYAAYSLLRSYALAVRQQEYDSYASLL